MSESMNLTNEDLLNARTEVQRAQIEFLTTELAGQVATVVKLRQMLESSTDTAENLDS